MFEDDRGALQQIGECLHRIEDALTSSNALASEVVWYRLGRIQQASSRLTPAYLAAHPQIVALGLPTLDETICDPHPPSARSKALARTAITVLKPLTENLPPPPAPKPSRANPASRFDHVVETLRAMEPRLRAQGITALYLFGSTARLEDLPISDVDLAFEVAADGDRPLGILLPASMSDEIQEALGLPVDLVHLASLREDVRERAMADATVLFRPTGR
jgi:uncharacterized protein